MLEIAEAEPTAVRTSIGNVEVNTAVKPIDRTGLFVPNQPFHLRLQNVQNAFNCLAIYRSENVLTYTDLILWNRDTRKDEESTPV